VLAHAHNGEGTMTNTATPNECEPIEGQLAIDELDAVNGGFGSVEHGTLGSNPKDQQFDLDAVIGKAVGQALGNIKFF
jgi:hypothetical protein